MNEDIKCTMGKPQAFNETQIYEWPEHIKEKLRGAKIQSSCGAFKAADKYMEAIR